MNILPQIHSFQTELEDIYLTMIFITLLETKDKINYNFYVTLEYALVAQLDRAVVSGTTSAGGSSPSERATRPLLRKRFFKYIRIYIIFTQELIYTYRNLMPSSRSLRSYCDGSRPPRRSSSGLRR